MKKDIFVGRKQEIAQLTDLVDAAAEGRGQFAAISGEPGIGKTRLTDAAAHIASGKGFLVQRGMCHEGQYVPSYWPWRQILGGLLEVIQPARLRARGSVFAEPLLDIVPEIRRLFPAAKGLPESSAENARAKILQGFAGLVRLGCESPPTLLILDNLHYADEPSLELLELLAREMASWHTIILVAYREAASPAGARMRETLGSLAGQGNFSQIRLLGWQAESVGAYLHAYLGSRPPIALVQALHGRTDGNPLFVSEAVRLLDHEGLLKPVALNVARAWEIHVPDKVRIAIMGRAQRHTPPCRELLAVAALIGRDFDPDIFYDMSVTSLLPVDRLWEEALANGLIEEDTRRETIRYRFAHALIQEVLAEGVPAPRRASLHLQIGEALERRFGETAETHAGTLAQHFEKAGPPAADKAVHYRKRAGEAALRACGFKDARDQFNRALDLVGDHVTNRERAELLSDLAQSEHGLGDFKESVENHSRAFDLYVQSGEAALAYQVVQAPYLLTDRGLGVTRLLERVISLFGPDSSEAHRLGFHYGLALYHDTGDYDRSVRVFRKALEYARRNGDRVTEGRTLGNWAQVENGEMHYEQAVEMAGQALPLASVLGDYWVEAAARSVQLSALISLGRFREAREGSRALSELCAKFESTVWRAGALSYACFLRRQEGSFTAFCEMARKALALGRTHLDSFILAGNAIIEYESCRPQKGEDLLRKALGSGEPPNIYNTSSILIGPYVSWVSGEAIGLNDVEATARAMLAHGNLSRAERATVFAAQGLVAIKSKDVASAAQSLVELQALRHPVVSAHFGMVTSHLLALLAGAAGDHPRAVAYFEDALAFCRRSGIRTELAYICRDFADHLLSDSPARDLERALAILREGQSVAENARIPLLMKQLGERQTKAGLAGEPETTGPDFLTTREIEVLRLLAEGMSNDRIGGRLFISPRTVANHVQSILAKTGAANRTEAAVHAIRRGLIGPRS